MSCSDACGPRRIPERRPDAAEKLRSTITGEARDVFYH
jgi:hypothetical protein